MIKTTLNREEIKEKINRDFIEDKRMLSSYSGFKDSKNPRKTFSIILSNDELEAIKFQSTEIYREIVSKLISNNKDVPFDFIRLDAFWYQDIRQIKIIEFNSLYVGMHEICEELDIACSHALDIPINFSLNKCIAQNQRKIFDQSFNSYKSLSYLSSKKTPRWLYYDAVKEVFNDKFFYDINQLKTLEIKKDGYSYVNGNRLEAVITKGMRISKPKRKILYELHNNGKIFILETPEIRSIGDQDNLVLLESDYITRTAPILNMKKEDLIIGKDKYVLKFIKSSSSFGVHLGSSYDNLRWKEIIENAYKNPKYYVIQEYNKNGKCEIIPHMDMPAMNVPIQLGIFLIPMDRENVYVDIVSKAYVGGETHFKFDPAEIMEDIWFGNVIVSA